MLGLAWIAAAAAQTQIDLSTQAKKVDFSNASSTKPLQVGSTLPGTCVTGQMFFKSDAPAGANLYACTSANTWSVEGGGAGLTAAGDANYPMVSTDRAVYHTALTASRTDTLPAASAVNAGTAICEIDRAGLLTSAITLRVAPHGSDSINGAASGPLLETTYAGACFLSDGSSNWTVMSDAASIVSGYGVLCSLVSGIAQCSADTSVMLTRLQAASWADVTVVDGGSGGTAFGGCPPGVTPPLTTYMEVELIPAHSSTGGAATFNYCSTGAAGLFEADGATNPSAGEISAGQKAAVWYDASGHWRLKAKPGGTGSGSGATVNPPTAGGIAYGASSTAYATTGAGTAKQIVLAGGSGPPALIDFPDVKIIPAANNNGGAAGAGWSLPGSGGFAAAARGGANNIGGVLQGTPSTGAYGTFDFELPSDWDLAMQPYIKIFYGSGSNTSGTVIWTVSSACSKGDGSGSDDAAWVTESAMPAQIMTTANRDWAQSAQFTNLTAGNNCSAGSHARIKVAVSGTATLSVNVEMATITVPRLLTVQGN